MNTYKKNEFSNQEKEIWATLEGKKLREIAKHSKINITRVFRIKNFGGMLVNEMNALNNYIVMIKNNWI